MARRPSAGKALEGVAGPQRQLALDRRLQQRGVLVDPAVDADFMAGFCDAPGLVRIDQGRDGRHEESRRHAVALQHAQDAGHAGPAAIFPPAKPADRTTAGTHLERLVVAVEGERDRAARTVLPA
jgi:hypothetical protein